MKHKLLLLTGILLLAVLPLKGEEALGIFRAIRGTVEMSMDEGVSWKKAVVGRQFSKGALIRTAKYSQGNIYLLNNGAECHLREESLLRIDSLTSHRKWKDKITSTQLDLRGGTWPGGREFLKAEANFTVKFPKGVAQTKGGRF